jgi:hypothetical protein
MPAASVSVMPSSDTEKAVDRPSSNGCGRLERWAAEGLAWNHYEGRANQ